MSAPIGVFDPVLLLGLGQDVVGALEPLDQVFAVVGVEGCRQRLGPFDQQGQVVVARHGDAGVDDVVPDALVAEIDLEAVVEEGEEVGSSLNLQYLRQLPVKAVFVQMTKLPSDRILPHHLDRQ